MMQQKGFADMRNDIWAASLLTASPWRDARILAVSQSVRSGSPNGFVLTNCRARLLYLPRRFAAQFHLTWLSMMVL